MGHWGHGLSAARRSGGRGRISSWATLLRAVADGGADAVGAGVAAADDHDVPPLRGDVLAVPEAGVEQALRVGGEELHGQVDAVEAPPLDRQVARLRGPGAEHHRLVVLHQPVGRDVLADLGLRDEADPLVGELLHPPLDHLLVELHVGDAVHEQAARAGRRARRR